MSGSSLQLVEQLFVETFGSPAAAVGSAPGRVNLIGEHTDYNDGFVLPMAIEGRTCVAVAPAGDGRWRFASNAQAGQTEMSDAEAMDAQQRDWTSYCRGVVAGFRNLGHEVPALRVGVASDVPVGSGLSSSAAIEVATASALEGLLGVRLNPVDKALLCQHAEHVFAGVPCGYMDQAISVMGKRDHALLIDCRSREATPVPVSDGSVSILIVNTMVRHELSGGEYAQRRAQCGAAVEAIGRAGGAVQSLRDVSMTLLESVRGRLDDVVWKRARHVVGEIARTTEGAALLARRDYPGFGRLMYESHDSLRDDYEVSCRELDLLVEMARRQRGTLGARMTGGGFGGCIVALVHADQAEAVGHAVATAYESELGISPQWFVTAPGEGARTERGAGAA